MKDPWEEFPYPNDLICGPVPSYTKYDGVLVPEKYCDGVLVHGWSRSYNCPKCGTHHDYDPFYIAALCEINLDKYPELREKYPSPFKDEYAIGEIEKHKRRLTNES